MKIEDIRAKTDAELEFDLNGLKKDLFDARFRAGTGTDGNTSRIREMKRNSPGSTPSSTSAPGVWDAPASA